MSELSDYSKFAEGPLVFPINGKNYTLPPLSIPLGIEISGIVAGTDKKWQKKNGVEFFKFILGPLWDELVADGVEMPAMLRVGVAAFAEYTDGRDLAIAAWETGADPKAIEPYMRLLEARKGNRASRRSSGTGGAIKTPPRVSTKATTSRKS